MMGTRDSVLASIAKTFPSSAGETQRDIWARMGADWTVLRAPSKVEAKKICSVLAKALRRIEEILERQAAMMMMLSFTLK